MSKLFVLGLQKTKNGIIVLIKYFFLKILLPTLTAFLVFITFAKIYAFYSGINRTTFAPQQLHAIIQNYLQDFTNSSNYSLIKTDLHGFGIESYIVISGRPFDEPAHSLPPQILILEEIQPDPIEKLLFSEKLYKKSFEFIPKPENELSNISFVKVIKYKNNRNRLLFCYDSTKCGIIQYDGNGYHVAELDIYKSKCLLPTSIKTNLGDVSLSEIPEFSRIFVKGNADEELYVASPLVKNGQPVWQDVGGALGEMYRGSSSKFQICKYVSTDEFRESFWLNGFQSLDFCYITNNEYFDDLYPHSIDKTEIPMTDAGLEKEISRSVGKWIPDLNFDFGLCKDPISHDPKDL